MFSSKTVRELPARKRLIGLILVSLLVVSVISTCVSCGESGPVETADQVKTTAERAELTESLYESIEMEMSYEEVVEIIGQGPYAAEDVDDPFRESGKLLKCTWLGKAETEDDMGEQQLTVSFKKGEVCEKTSSNI